MNIEFQRRKEIQKLLQLKGNGRIKVIEGLRQVGKSFLLKKLFFRKLIDLSISKEKIALLDFLEKDDDIRNEQELKTKIKSLLDVHKIQFLFMDEIQLVKNYGTILKSVHLQHPELDIYITGSNSKTLSKDIQREIGAVDSDEIFVRPLSFEEIKLDYPSFTFSEYFNYGGLPKVIRANTAEEKERFLTDLYRETYEKDILDRVDDLQNIGENEKRKILQKIFDTITTGVSLKSISQQINSNNKAIIKNSSAVHAEVDTFIKRVADSFLFEIMETDTSGSKQSKKKALENNEKCYCEDHGLLRHASHAMNLDSAVFENLIFTNLIAKGYQPVSLKFDYLDSITGEECKNREIDFSFVRNGIRHLVQAVLVLTDENYQREVHNLLFSEKGEKKIIVYNYDATIQHPNSQGIEFIQIEHFLNML